LTATCPVSSIVPTQAPPAQAIGTRAEPPDTTTLALDTVTAGSVTASGLLLALA
jgi:hypothetical protein